MKYTIIFNPDFYNDIEQAVDWYNDKQKGLRDKLFQSIKKQTKKLSSDALNFAIRYDDVRCLLIDKFPYMVHYRIIEQIKTVKIEALFHTSRNPEIWLNKK